MGRGTAVSDSLIAIAFDGSAPPQGRWLLRTWSRRRMRLRENPFVERFVGSARRGASITCDAFNEAGVRKLMSLRFVLRKSPARPAGQGHADSRSHTAHLRATSS